jgi:predicted component of type VI protein secretion system
VGKLVLFIADGTTMDIPLDKERITIGRRADNDVCLPYPAVSGEHAAVVTILADSFLEDLGSTNGTLVNGKAIVKHFLTDHDQIDIGRQRLTYMSDNDARVDAVTADRNQLRGLSEKVEPARPPVQSAVHPTSPGGSQVGSRNAPLLADLEHDASAAAGVPAGALATSSVPTARGPGMLAKPRESSAPIPHAPGPASDTRADAAPASDAVPVAPAGPVASVRVLSGASLGRTVQFVGDQLTVGRAGVQVAVVRRAADGYRLVPLEGSVPPRINGAPVAPEGSPLHPGDTFEVAGVRLELSVNS